MEMDMDVIKIVLWGLHFFGPARQRYKTSLVLLSLAGTQYPSADFCWYENICGNICCALQRGVEDVSKDSIPRTKKYIFRFDCWTSGHPKYLKLPILLRILSHRSDWDSAAIIVKDFWLPGLE